MQAQANCYADVLRAVVTDAAGDEVDDGQDYTPVYRRVPMSILERRRSVLLPGTLAPRTIRYTVGRCNGDLLIQENDQIRDTTHGNRVYMITELSRIDSPVTAIGDWNMQLERITGGATTP